MFRVMFKCQNGFTKEKMKEVIKLRNNGMKCVNSDNRCVYLNENGNSCVAGCFIPRGHRAQHKALTIDAIMTEHVDLKMPLDLDGMCELQVVHDLYGYGNSETLHEALFKWIDENVED